LNESTSATAIDAASACASDVASACASAYAKAGTFVGTIAGARCNRTIFIRSSNNFFGGHGHKGNDSGTGEFAELFHKSAARFKFILSHMLIP